MAVVDLKVHPRTRLHMYNAGELVCGYARELLACEKLSLVKFHLRIPRVAKSAEEMLTKYSPFSQKSRLGLPSRRACYLAELH